MINPDITLIIQMINFLILLFVLNLILFRPIRKIIKERNQIVEDFNNDIASLTDNAQESLGQFEQKIQEARKEGLVSTLVAPLASGGSRIGVLRAYTGRVHAFTPFEV